MAGQSLRWACATSSLGVLLHDSRSEKLAALTRREGGEGRGGGDDGLYRAGRQLLIAFSPNHRGGLLKCRAGNIAGLCYAPDLRII